MPPYQMPTPCCSKPQTCVTRIAASLANRLGARLLCTICRTCRDTMSGDFWEKMFNQPEAPRIFELFTWAFFRFWSMGCGRFQAQKVQLWYHSSWTRGEGDKVHKRTASAHMATCALGLAFCDECCKSSPFLWVSSWHPQPSLYAFSHALRKDPGSFCQGIVVSTRPLAHVSGTCVGTGTLSKALILVCKPWLLFS